MRHIQQENPKIGDVFNADDWVTNYKIDSNGNDAHIENCLKESLKLASDNDRLIVGMSSCATTMDEHPTSVMMCLVPEDALGPLFMILARSGCNNLGLPLAVVKSHEKLAKFLDINEMEYGIVNCIVIQRPETATGWEMDLEDHILKNGNEDDVHLPWT